MQRSWREAAAARRVVLEAELPALVRRLVALGAKRVVLFGSLARGDVRSTSDIDRPKLQSGRPKGRPLAIS